jgi:uncharacterized OB-fold protein
VSLPLPEPTPLTEPYWRALADGHLVFQRCARCGHAWLPAREECPACLADGPAWERASGRGEIVSFVVYHVAYDPSFAERLPYDVAVVRLDEGPRLLTNVVAPHDALAVGGRVKLRIEREDGFALARFEPDPEPQHPR